MTRSQHQRPRDPQPEDQRPRDPRPEDQRPGDPRPEDQRPEGGQSPRGKSPRGQSPGGKSPGGQSPGSRNPRSQSKEHTSKQQTTHNDATIRAVRELCRELGRRIGESEKTSTLQAGRSRAAPLRAGMVFLFGVLLRFGTPSRVDSNAVLEGARSALEPLPALKCRADLEPSSAHRSSKMRF